MLLKGDATSCLSSYVLLLAYTEHKLNHNMLTMDYQFGYSHAHNWPIDLKLHVELF